MTKRIITLIVLLLATLNYAQDCNCSSNLKWLIETFEQNDAGFQYVIDQKGQDAYSTHNTAFQEKALQIQDKAICLKLLNDWTEFFRKNHLSVSFNNQQTQKNNLSDEEVLNLYHNSPKYKIKDAFFEDYISHLKQDNAIEGIWNSPPYTIGIIKDTKNSKRAYVGFIIESKSPYWQKNQIKLEIFKKDDGSLTMNYYMRDHSIRKIEQVELLGNYMLATFITLKKVKPILPETNPNKALYTQSIFANKPFLDKINDNTLLLRIPSFRHNMKKEIDSLLLNNNKLISSTENLIIDLRYNGGGSDASYEKIIPYIYTNPIRGLGVQFRSTKLNNQRMVDFINSPDWSDEDRKWAKKSLKKLNKHIGEFINLNNDIVSVDTIENVLPFPKSVGILINGSCGSTTEQFLLAAKQSKKVKLFGTTTVGSLDISNMYFVNSPCGEYKLGYGLTKSYRIPEMLIDGKGIQPDFYFDKTIKPYEWIQKTEEIMNYK